MHAFMTSLLLMLPVTAADATVSEQLAACAAVAAEATAEPPAPGLVSTELLARVTERAAVDSYVRCAADAGLVEAVVILANGSGVATLADASTVEFVLPTDAAAWTVADLAESGATLSAADDVEFPLTAEVDESSGSNPVVAIVAIALVTAFAGWLVWSYVSRRRKGLLPTSSATGGKSPAQRVKRPDIPSTRFSDIAGAAEAVEDLREMVDVLQHPDRYASLGARPPKGALLVGPPGTGKTLLARAVAGEAGVPFFSAAGSDFVEKYVGVGSKRVRDLFEQAKKAERAIVFIDEIDAVGRRRSSGDAHPGEVEGENTLIALLNELDGFRSSNVIVLGATNRADVLDPALLRPGRLDRKIHVGLPDARERAAVLAIHARSKPVADDVDMTEVARRTPGMSGAQLEQICNEAALLAAREQQTKLSASHFSAAVEYVAMGRARRSVTVHEDDRQVTAWHEAGHTVAALSVPYAARPVAVSIVPRGQAGGVTWMADSDRALVSRQELEARLVVALAGRAAEERFLGGECTAGAAGDLVQATATARAMAETLGMTTAGLATERADRSSVDAAVAELLRAAHERAHLVLEERRDLLEAVASALLERNDLSAADLATLDSAHPSTAGL